MLVKEMTRGEIEKRFNEMGDYVKIDYLSSCLKNRIDFDTRKFVLVKLAGLYEQKKMYTHAAECMRNAAEINTSTQTRTTDFLKAIDLYVKGGEYSNAEGTMRLALSSSSEQQKDDIKRIVKETYRSRAKHLLDTGKRKGAMDIYEILLEMKLPSDERDAVAHELLALYEKLGKIREYYALKSKLS